MVERLGGTIRLLGDPAILDADGRSQPVRGHQSWALLARVLLARAPLDRRTLAAELFPETVDPLGSLRWCLASLRKALNASDCLTGDPVEGRFADTVDIDVLRLDHDAFDIEAAGPLLGTLEPRCSPEFATWLLVERERIAGIVEARIRQETIRAMAVEDHGRATRLAELGVRRSPYDESAHILLVKSLALAGRYQAALDHVEATEAVFVAEFGEKPSSALRSAARRTISSPPSGISRQAFVSSLMQSGLAALSAGAVEAGIDCLRRAVRDAEMLKDAHLTARAMFELGSALVHSVRGYDDEGSVLLRRSTELARQAGSQPIASAGFRELGYVEALAGRRPSAATYLAQALDLAGGGENLAGIHAVMGFNLVDWGRIGEGLDHYGLSLEHARSAGNRRREIWSLGLGGWGLLTADRLEEADRWLADCLALVEEQRWISFRPWPVAVLSESRTRQQARPEALRPGLEEAFALSCQMNDPCWEGAVARALALTYAAEDAFEPAMEWLVEARRRCMRDTDSYAGLQVEILASQVDINLKLNRPGTADAVAREWLALAARTHRDTHVARAAAFIARSN
ncbi:BTAD domain-containing putative transcriptional regulator [Mesorhizobium sp.]|uniref:BTAD domain-containing putative transcriptional regulator n=1 Tax=Mesorhizobium sp. TaxID=1871066 RepID=UPI00356692BB